MCIYNIYILYREGKSTVTRRPRGLQNLQWLCKAKKKKIPFAFSHARAFNTLQTSLEWEPKRKYASWMGDSGHRNQRALSCPYFQSFPWHNLFIYTFLGQILRYDRRFLIPHLLLLLFFPPIFFSRIHIFTFRLKYTSAADNNITSALLLRYKSHRENWSKNDARIIIMLHILSQFFILGFSRAEFRISANFLESYNHPRCLQILIIDVL